MSERCSYTEHAGRPCPDRRELLDWCEGCLYDEVVRLRDVVNRGRAYRESQEGLPEGTLPREPAASPEART